MNCKSKKSPIREDGKFENGGEITGGSPWTNFMGKSLARKDDEGICEQHGPTTIDEWL